MREFKIINPYSCDELATFTFETPDQCQSTINKLQTTYLAWKETPHKTKSKWLNKLGESIQKNKQQLAYLISSDMGKPVNESLKEVQKCIECCYFYAKKLPKIELRLSDENGFRSPVGVVLGIMPWNFPLWQLIRFIVPAISVGNTCAIKPAFNTYRIALELIKCCPKSHPIIDCIIPTDTDTSALISHHNVAGVSFTGSVPVGKKIGQLAGSQFKPCVLELGGSDPFLIFKDANLDEAVEAAVISRFSNAGQTCISAKRFLFDSAIFDEATALLKQKTQQFLNFNNPINDTTTIGPMARRNLKEALLEQLNRATLEQHHIIFNYTPQQESGFFVKPLIVDARSLPSNNPLLTEEIFGPIAVCDSFNSLEDGIEKANNTTFGLGASIWSDNKTIINTCINKIDCGNLAINKPVHSAFNTPFGGWKQSGIGVELGIDGALSFTRFKGIQYKLPH
ncbi:MAG: aldehyde dehydrogenase family protein [Candidatus Margulisiibacteriota bacterium]|nr:aldehyde dehydrogenase family protein [Candidatus Margulisiibacteriota bacterium]